jgi:hypothetical protein
VRAWTAEVEHRVKPASELVEDRGDATLTLDGQLNLDRDTTTLRDRHPVREMLTGQAITGKDPLD